MASPTDHLREGWGLQRSGRLDEAERAYRLALDLDPRSADAWCLLGALDMVRQRFDGAIAHFTEQLRWAPRSAEAHNNLAVALSEVGRLDEAVAHGREAIRIKPEYVEAHNNLGLALRDCRRHEEALETFETALKLRPDHAEALNNLGVLLTELGELDEAIAALQRATTTRPDYVEAWLNLGSALRDAARVDEAESAYDQALRLRPKYPEAEYHRGLLHLLRGDLERGWAGFEARLACRAYPRFAMSTPRWDGSECPQATLLVLAEQGLGDTVQFARFLPETARRVGRLVCVVPSALVGAFRAIAGVAEVHPQDGPAPPHDLHAPLLSLPRLLGVRDLGSRPYLTPDPALMAAWNERLAGLPGLKVGLFWKGNPLMGGDPRRSFRPSDLAPLAGLEGVTWVRLQAVDANEGDTAPLDMLDPGHLGPAEGLDELIALIAVLDLVITPDTLGAHLAGALGRPVWVALPRAREWRWGLGGESTWYSTARLFRQPQAGHWDLVFERMAAELPSAMSRREAVPTVTIPVAPAELLDKLTILEIKLERVLDLAKLRHVQREHALLADVRARTVLGSPRLEELTTELKAANVAIWDVEEIVRRCERDQDFGPRFIEAARAVYRENDRRAALKRAINELLGSAIQEVKSHAGLVGPAVAMGESQ